MANKQNTELTEEADSAAKQADVVTAAEKSATPKDAPKQVEMPFAIVQGEAVTSMPQDLYIPPDALEVFLEAFEGPLDLLLYLIKRQNLDVLDIPIAEITRQYMEYISLMENMRLELAAEYLVMAAMLAEIKSRILLPRPVEEDADENDPRAELVRRLQEYERFKQAAEEIERLPRLGRELHSVNVEIVEQKVVKLDPEVDLKDLLSAFKDVLHRAEMFTNHHIEMEPLSVRERMSSVLSMVNADTFTAFTKLFDVSEGKMGVVVTFLAILELIKESLLELVQAEAFSPIHVKAVASSEQKPHLVESEANI